MNRFQCSNFIEPAIMKSVILIAYFLLLLITPLHGQNSGLEFNQHSPEEGFKGRYINSLMQDHLGFIWISSVGTYKYDGYNFIHHLDLPGCKNCPPAANYYIKKMEEDDIGLFWILTINGIKLYDPEKERTIMVASSMISDAYNFSYGYESDLLIDSQGSVWASAQNGLIKVSYNDVIEKPVTSDMIFNSHPDTIFIVDFLNISPDIQSDKNKVLSIYEDKWGDIWVGTADGLFFFKNGNRTFLRVDSDTDSDKRLPGRRVYDILQYDDNTLWIATSNGLVRISNINNALHDKTSGDISSLNFSGYMEGTGRVSSLFKDKNNNLLISTGKDLYIMKINGQTGKLSFEPVYRNFSYSYGPGYNQGFMTIMEDRSGELWFWNEYNYLMKFKLEKSNFTSYSELTGIDFNKSIVGSIIQDQYNNTWIGTNGSGLIKINSADYTVSRFDPGPAKKQIRNIIQTEPDVFILGLNKGILAFNALTGKFTDPIAPGESRAADNLRNTC